MRRHTKHVMHCTMCVGVRCDGRRPLAVHITSVASNVCAVNMVKWQSRHQMFVVDDANVMQKARKAAKLLSSRDKLQLVL